MIGLQVSLSAVEGRRSSVMIHNPAPSSSSFGSISVYENGSMIKSELPSPIGKPGVSAHASSLSCSLQN